MSGTDSRKEKNVNAFNECDEWFCSKLCTSSLMLKRYVPVQKKAPISNTRSSHNTVNDCNTGWLNVITDTVGFVKNLTVKEPDQDTI